ncbi:hypothetical protein O181_003087 [Austropuccinia psidii MF-1]|uniref:Chromo domain-containing protein n=1 Tax=Austropuccinia psidii MF-1 TaxID=1389203 RepID=A0A9Q3BDP8_9BASI|nr:hypothetical protein [Austropuccinia psidii MF-1]
MSFSNWDFQSVFSAAAQDIKKSFNCFSSGTRWTDGECKSYSRTVSPDVFHPVFHVTLLEPVKTSSIPNCNQLPPPPVLVEEQEEREVVQVQDSKLKRDKLWYLLEWKGFSEDPERITWEPASILTNSPDLVNNFHSLYPDKPGPNTSRV